MLNPAIILKAKAAKDKFCTNHPKFIAFLNAAKNNGLHEGTVVDITFTSPDGHKLNSNIRLCAEDIESYNDMLALLQNKQ